MNYIKKARGIIDDRAIGSTDAKDMDIISRIDWSARGENIRGGLLSSKHAPENALVEHCGRLYQVVRHGAHGTITLWDGLAIRKTNIARCRVPKPRG